MGDKTAIEWTDATWNPIRARNPSTGKVGHYCEHVTEACRFCYAERMNRWRGTGIDYQRQNRDQVEIFLDDEVLLAPLRWKRPRMIFPCSMTDLFGDFVPDAWIDRMFGVMEQAHQHTFQILTKRPKRQRDYVTAIDELNRAAGGIIRRWPLPNVWAGTSVHDQPSADEFVPELLATPAARRILSCEPLLGPIDLTWLAQTRDQAGEPTSAIVALPSPRDPAPKSYLHWVIAGGESGPNARPMHPDWARSLRDQCAAAGLPFFFKQWGEWAPLEGLLSEAPSHEGVRVWTPGFPGVASIRRGKKAAGRLLDGREHSEMPDVDAGFRDRAARDAGARG